MDAKFARVDVEIHSVNHDTHPSSRLRENESQEGSHQQQIYMFIYHFYMARMIINYADAAPDTVALGGP